MNVLDYLDKFKLDNKKMILVGIASIFLVYLDIVFIMRPQLSAIKASFEKISKLKKDIAMVASELAKIKSQGALQVKAAKFKKIISEDQLPGLLQEIYTVARSNKINILQLKPSRESKEKKEKTSAQPERIIPISVKLDLEGDYHNFGSFINGIENAEQFMAVEEIKIVQSPDNYLQQKEFVTVKTYVKK